MKKICGPGWFVLLVSFLPLAGYPAESSGTFFLRDGWALQSGADAGASGDVISSRAFRPNGWQAATVPSTVVGALVDDNVFPDPFFGMNLKSLPGMDYPIGANFSGRAFSTNSPFRGAWWYRTQFAVAPRPGGEVWLNFDGINYRANIWLNGKKIAGTNEVVGAYRTFEFNVTHAVDATGTNVLAVEVFPPDVNSLAITWVDWNPMPPDKVMGLWRDVSLTTTGPVSLAAPQVVSKIDQPSLDAAHLTVSAELRNPGDKPAKATLRGRIEKIRFEQTVELAPHETREIVFTPDKFAQLNISKPRLWWPVHVGAQNLYDLKLEAVVNGKISDETTVPFGIREASSELNAKGYRIFKINGKPILVRGGGWAPDIFLRPSAEREIQEIRYVKDMNLNTIRFEGKTETARFLELCDREGIMVIAGWCCCDYWERWSRWQDEDYRIASESLRSQVRRIRNHPSVITWWYGSDNPPNARAESNYLAVLKEMNWPNSAQASASAKRPAVGEPTGIRMTGPYEYVPPVYWYVDTNAGGAYCFNTETSPGPAIPPVESLRRMLPREHLWPIDDYWRYHAGGGPFHNLDIFTEALNRRLGTATGVDDYAQKAQLLTYDGERAMFEAYARNKYDSTGVIQWMMNNAWPSMIWHLYDYYLRPGGGYFGTKKACEPLHIQYSLDDRSVVVVNGFYEPVKGLHASAKVYNLDMTEKFSQWSEVTAAPDSSRRVFVLPELPDLTDTYFVKLVLKDAQKRVVSDNFYWLSRKPESIAKPKSGSDWYYTPTKEFADLTALNRLPKADLKCSAKSAHHGNEGMVTVTLENPGRSLAFFVRLKVDNDASGEEVLPVIWQDNYVSLLPGEKKEITARYDLAQLRGGGPVVEVSGWNLAPKTVPVR
jgi:exo-1,4-beta-D-glucosaminidase